MKKLVLISSLTMMAVLATGAEQKKPTSSAKSATHSHTAAKTAHASSGDKGKTRAMHAGQGNKKGLTKQHTSAANSKGHKRGHKKYLLFGKRSG